MNTLYPSTEARIRGHITAFENLKKKYNNPPIEKGDDDIDDVDGE